MWIDVNPTTSKQGLKIHLKKNLGKVSNMGFRGRNELGPFGKNAGLTTKER